MLSWRNKKKISIFLKLYMLNSYIIIIIIIIIKTIKICQQTCAVLVMLLTSLSQFVSVFFVYDCYYYFAFVNKQQHDRYNVSCTYAHGTLVVLLRNAGFKRRGLIFMVLRNQIKKEYEVLFQVSNKCIRKKCADMWSDMLTSPSMTRIW